MKWISQVEFTERVAIVSFDRVPSGIGFLSELFRQVAEDGVNVDMISQTAPSGSHNAISFTVDDDLVPQVLASVKKVKDRHPGLSPMVSPGNVKLCLFGESIPGKVGVAADAFDILCAAGVEVLLVTTSDMDISVVVSHAQADLAYRVLTQE